MRKAMPLAALFYCTIRQSTASIRKCEKSIRQDSASIRQSTASRSIVSMEFKWGTSSSLESREEESREGGLKGGWLS